MLKPMRPLILPCFLLLVIAATAGAADDDRRGPFTEAPRSVRTRPYDALHLRLELAFDWTDRVVQGRAVHRLKPFEPTSTIEFDAVRMTVEAVTLVGKDGAEDQELKFEKRPETLRITLDRQYAADEELELAVTYRLAAPTKGVYFVVPDDQEPDQARMVWTQSEPEEARYWFPCLDSPNDRLTSEVLATVPADYFVLSNGVLTDKQDHGDGTRTWHWVQHKSHVPYLISVVAGEFEAYEQSWREMPVISYVPKGRLADAARSFQHTPEMVELYSEKFGYRYPWPKYTQICCDEYIWGGMEHTSATTLTLRILHDERAHLDLSSENLVAHELVHQWFGDLLTCKDWAELWLNESFATYFATYWTEHKYGWDEAAWERYEEGEEYFSEDANRYRRPIVSYRYRAPDDMFDGHSYPKGGRVLHMLRNVLGDEMFWKAVRHYTQANEFGVVETADLRRSIEAATGQGLNWFFDQWVYHGGHPEFQVESTWDDAQQRVRLVVRQTQTVDDMTPLFRCPVEIELQTADGPKIENITVSKAEETFHFDLDQRPRWVAFDPRDWVLKKLAFKQSKEDLLAQLADSKDMIVRVRAAGWLETYQPDADALAGLVEAAENDPFRAVRQQAVKVIGKFPGDEARQALTRVLAGDEHAKVRRAAARALQDFPHDDVRAALRARAADDPSYFVAAESLKQLVEVDRAGVREDLVAAIDRTSQFEVILRAAADGLAELDDVDSLDALLAILEPPSPPDRRIAVLGAIAKLGHGDAKVTDALARQLDDARSNVRGAAIAALGETGDRRAIEMLLKHRSQEPIVRVQRSVDDAVKKLRDGGQLNELRKEVERLETRLEQLEAKEEK